MPRSTKKRGAPSRRGRVLFAVFLGTASALLAVALVAYLQDGNWHQPVGSLAPRMGRVSYAAASTVVRACGAFGAWLVAIALAAFAIRLAVGRPLFGFRRRTLVSAALVVALAQSFAAL